VAAHEWDEAGAREQLPGEEAKLAALEEPDVVGPSRPDRLNQAAARPELLRERFRDARICRGDEHGVEGRVPGETLAPVSDDDLDVLDCVCGEICACGLGNVREPFDRVDARGQVSEEGRLPAVAGADLQDPLGAREAKGLHHPCHEGRLSGHLAVRDRQRQIEVGVVSQLRRDEVFPRERPHRLQHSRVSHSLDSAGFDEIQGRFRPHAASIASVTAWPSSPEALMRLQEEIAATPATPWRPSGRFTLAGCFVCFSQPEPGPGEAGDPGWAGAALGERTAVAFGHAGSRYEAGLLALREGALLEEAARLLPELPDVLLVNATGRDHPRRAGLAVHLGAVLDLPTVGVTHRPLMAEGEWPADDRGATSPLLYASELVGYWLRTARGKRPLAVHAGWRVGPDAAVEAVLASTGATRTPDPIRRARTAARHARAAAAPER
jgi:deoxyribonuclease V